MRRAVVFLCLMLPACALKPLPPPSPRLIRAVIIACIVDRVAQPILVDVAGNFGVVGGTAATIDNLLVHPLVVAGCARVHGTPLLVIPETPVIAPPVLPPVTP